MMDDESLAIFRAEADSLAQSLEAGLLALQGHPGDRDLIDQVFRDLHTLKGTGAMFGYTELAGFVHDFESAFEAVRSGASLASPALIDVSLQAHDHIVALLDGGRPGGAEDILSSLAAAVARPSDVARPAAQFPMPPDPAPATPAEDLVLTLASAKLAIDRLEVEAEPKPVDRLHPPARRADGSGSPGSAMIRIPADRLDEMMDRVGELVIAEARLAELAASSSLPALVAVTEDIQRLATGMRDAAMSIRMTPLSTITGRFRRLVHDLSVKLGKPIELVVSGEETELDKSVVEQLAEPLMHLIRNSVDHGIEDPDTRELLFKPATGRLTLSARHYGSGVLIQLSDDGRGLDPARIRARATALGLLAPNADIAQTDLFRLVLAPGFSTAEQVTELSGRGVGMDVVRRTVEDLRGRLDIDSEPGQGTRISLKLPLTLAIIDGLLVEVAEERFIIPLTTVEEIVELPEAKASDEATSRLLDIRGRLVPYLALRDRFASRGKPGPYPKIVVVSAGDTRLGLVVDRIIGSNQTVIKQLSPLHAGLRTFSGATILGDGTVALILDVSAFAGAAQPHTLSAMRQTEVFA